MCLGCCWKNLDEQDFNGIHLEVCNKLEEPLTVPKKCVGNQV
jgi:hypothetical protein